MIRRLSGMAIGLAMLAVSGSAALAHDVHIEGQVRIRYQGDDRSFADNSKMTHSLSQRTRISADVKNDKGARIFIQISDSRMWGDEGSTFADTENVDLHQAWVLLTDPNVDGLEWTLGRQELHYGGGRVFSRNDWDNVGQAFDAARAHYAFADNQWFDVAFAKVSDDNATGIDENLAFLIWHVDVDMEDAGLQIEPLLVYKENSATNQYLTSFGDYAKLQVDRFGLHQNFVYQTGKVMDHDAAAYLIDAAVMIDASGDMDGSAGVGGGFSVQSGDDPTDPDDSAYDNLYYDYHKVYGAMDMAQQLADNLQGGGTGLKDFYGKGWYHADNGFWLKGAVHVFKTEVDVVGAGDGNSLGTEFDAILGKDLESGMSAQIGGGLFSPGDLVKDLFGEDKALWIYAQGTATF